MMYIEGFPSGFEPSVNVPLDKRTKIADITAADATFLATAYVGLIVFDEATSAHVKITATDGTQGGLTYEVVGGGAGVPTYFAGKRTTSGSTAMNDASFVALTHSGSFANQVYYNTGEPELGDLINSQAMMATIPAGSYSAGDKIRIRRVLDIAPTVNGTGINYRRRYTRFGSSTVVDNIEKVGTLDQGAGVVQRLIHEDIFVFGEACRVSEAHDVHFAYRADAPISFMAYYHEVEVVLYSKA